VLSGNVASRLRPLLVAFCKDISGRSLSELGDWWATVRCVVGNDSGRVLNCASCYEVKSKAVMEKRAKYLGRPFIDPGRDAHWR
jgi:hypothetical protein